tara:strand:- start:5157 stop:6332 length:1176 start_codon:yes stop_codon:yes gene_type:complete
LFAPIVAAEPGKAVVLLRSNEEGWARSTLARAGFWPTWRPGHEAIGVSVVVDEGKKQRSSVEMLDLEGNHLRTLFESPIGGDAVIAQNVPHYVVWSPDGTQVAVVAQGSAGLTLFLSEAEGPLIADPIQTGAPLFLAWSPDGGRLAVHAGVNLSVLELAEARASRPISADARGFRTPVFSDDGKLLAFATPGATGEGVVVRVVRGLGEENEPAHELPGGVALGFRPGSYILTIAVTTSPASGAFDELWTIDLSTNDGEPTLLVRRPFTSFFWDPTGEKLAFVVPSTTGDGMVSLQARSAQGEFMGASPPFLPSIDYQTMAGFFDQYGTSHHLWSPDGSVFLAAGRLLTDSPAVSFGDGSRDSLFGWNPRRGAPLEHITEGGIGFFPPVALG